MSTHVVNESHAKPGRGDEVPALLLQLSPERWGRPVVRRSRSGTDQVTGAGRVRPLKSLVQD